MYTGLLFSLAEAPRARVAASIGLTRRDWRQAVLIRDHFRCRWCGAATSLCAHHIREISRYPCAELELDNGLTLCWECHFWEAHGGHPNFVHGRYARSRRPLPGQLELFARWPGALFEKRSAVSDQRSAPPPIGTVWPGPQGLLFAMESGGFAAVR
jgi:hypothetical protein